VSAISLATAAWLGLSVTLEARPVDLAPADLGETAEDELDDQEDEDERAGHTRRWVR
jgi:hypothetical protein